MVNKTNRCIDHPILGSLKQVREVTIYFDGNPIPALEGEPIAAALASVGVRTFRYTTKYQDPRGIFCAIGRCTDCMMIVDGQPNVRTCITPVRDGMYVKTQYGLG